MSYNNKPIRLLKRKNRLFFGCTKLATFLWSGLQQLMLNNLRLKTYYGFHRFIYKLKKNAVLLKLFIYIYI